MNARNALALVLVVSLLVGGGYTYGVLVDDEATGVAIFAGNVGTSQGDEEVNPVGVEVGNQAGGAGGPEACADQNETCTTTAALGGSAVPAPSVSGSGAPAGGQ